MLSPGVAAKQKTGHEGKLHNLGQVYFYMKKRKPALCDRQIAEVLAAQPACGFGKNAELIRQRLPSAKRIFVEFCVCRASSFVYDVFCEEEVYILEKKGVTPPAPMTLVAGPSHGAPFIWFKVSRV